MVKSVAQGVAFALSMMMLLFVALKSWETFHENILHDNPTPQVAFPAPEAMQIDRLAILVAQYEAVVNKQAKILAAIEAAQPKECVK